MGLRNEFQVNRDMVGTIEWEGGSPCRVCDDLPPHQEVVNSTADVTVEVRPMQEVDRYMRENMGVEEVKAVPDIR
jgi:hypothetical protein